MSSNIFKVDEILQNLAVRRSLRYNSFDSKKHWTQDLALRMKKKMSSQDYQVWLNKYLAELNAKRRSKKY